MFIWYIYTYYININLLCQVGQLYYHWLIDRRLIFERTHLLIDCPSTCKINVTMQHATFIYVSVKQNIKF